MDGGDHITHLGEQLTTQLCIGDVEDEDSKESVPHSAAAAKVWATTELVEAIIEQLDLTTDIVKCKAVCYAWKNVVESDKASKIIKRNLFLESWARLESTPSSDDYTISKWQPGKLSLPQYGKYRRGDARFTTEAINPALAVDRVNFPSPHSFNVRIGVQQLSRILQADNALAETLIIQPSRPAYLLLESTEGTTVSTKRGSLLSLGDLDQACAHLVGPFEDGKKQQVESLEQCCKSTERKIQECLVDGSHSDLECDPSWSTGWETEKKLSKLQAKLGRFQKRKEDKLQEDLLIDISFEDI